MSFPRGRALDSAPVHSRSGTPLVRGTLPSVDDRRWRMLADAQQGLLSWRQLRGLGVTHAEVRHHVLMGRWAHRSTQVVSTTTGPLSHAQRLWLGALHAGPSAMIAGLSAAEIHGLKGWPRDDITVLVGNPMSFEPLEGFAFFRSRRKGSLLLATQELPVCRLEPAVLLFASEEPHLRTALGAVAAVTQQRLTTPERLRGWIGDLAPLRRAAHLRALLSDLAGGAQSLAEVDVHRACREYGVAPPNAQRPRLDRSGRRRYTDCEWRLADGRTLVLEIDGGFHDEVLQAMDDRRRNRRLTTPTRVVVSCSAFEIRHEPWAVMEDLIALGVPLLHDRAS